MTWSGVRAEDIMPPEEVVAFTARMKARAAQGAPEAHSVTYEIHPVAEIFPLMPEGALDELAEDIKKKGLLHSVVKHNGQVIDGRNRLAACKRAGVPPTFIEWSGTGSVVAWILSTNLHRRHLTDQQRAMVAGRVAAALAIEGREKSVQNLRKSAGLVEGLDPGPRVETGEDLSETGAEDLEKKAPQKRDRASIPLRAWIWALGKKERRRSRLLPS